MASNATDATLRVLVAEDTVMLPVSLSSTVGELKDLLANSPHGQKLSGKWLRVIHAGKILADDVVLGDSGVSNGTTLHVAVSEARDTCTTRPGGGSPAGGEREAPPRSGFDRLRDLGLEDEQVVALRSHFFTQVFQLEGEFPRQEGEEESDRLARMEDAWMARQPRMSEFGINIQPLAATARAQGTSLSALGLPSSTEYTESEEGSLTDLLWGWVMGFFLGFLMLLWVFQESVSTRQRMGVFAGIFCNMALTVVRNVE